MIPRISPGKTWEGFLGAPLIGPTVFGKCAGLGLAGGGAFRAISPAGPLCPGVGLPLTDGLDSVVGNEFESAEATFAKDSESRMLSMGFSSKGETSSSLLAPDELSESMRDRLVIVEDGPIGLTWVAVSSGGFLRD